jgi:hypothetical protein
MDDFPGLSDYLKIALGIAHNAALLITTLQAQLRRMMANPDNITELAALSDEEGGALKEID